VENRIKALLKAKNINASKLADEIGIQRSSMSHVLNGRNKPSLDFIQKILETYPDINAEWLIRGTGLMFSNGDLFSGTASNLANPGEDQKSVIRMPLYDDEAPVADDNQGNSLNPPAAPLEKSRPQPRKTAAAKSVVKETPEEIEMVLVLYRNGTVKQYRALVACGSSG
jgi:transcriptional regulator with XRE-family HTH domain